MNLLHLIHTTRDYKQYSAIAVVHTLRLTVAHALGFSVFTSRILATGLSQPHCNFKSHMKSSCHSLILPCHFCSCQFRNLDSTALYCCSIILLLCCYSYILRRVFWLYPLITPRTDPKKNTVFCRQGRVFIGPLPINGRPIRGGRCFVGMCLPASQHHPTISAARISNLK
jgi:hypothetical protein